MSIYSYKQVLLLLTYYFSTDKVSELHTAACTAD
jgi:hypothetical protein